MRSTKEFGSSSGGEGLRAAWPARGSGPGRSLPGLRGGLAWEVPPRGAGHYSGTDLGLGREWPPQEDRSRGEVKNGWREEMDEMRGP